MRRALLLIPFLALLPAFAQTNCVFTISPTIISVPARGPSPDGTSSGVVQITASAGNCPRTSVSNVEWITISFGTPGTGNGSTGYTVKPNTNPVPRSGTVQIAGLLLTVNQAAASCTFQLNPSRTRFPAEGGAATLAIVTACSWTAVSTVDWIVFGPHIGGPGNGTVPFTVTPNPANQDRTGQIQLGNQSVLITQTAAGCTFTLSPANANVTSDGATGSFTVNAPAGCAWSVSTPAAWLTISTSGSTVSYTASPNRTPQTRIAGIAVGDASFTLTQAAANCSFVLSPPSASVSSAIAQGAFAVTTACEWTAVAEASWLSVTSGASGSGNGSVSYVVAANNANQPRTGNIKVSGRLFSVTQAAAVCTYTLSPQSATIASNGATATVNVSASDGGCNWDATSNTAWIRVLAVTKSGTQGTVSYNVAPSEDGLARSGSLIIAGLPFSVLQTEAGPEISAAGIVNAASYRSGAISPGEIITLFGLRLGPGELTTLQLTPDGSAITKELAGTRVLFDDQDSPMVFSSAGQISAIVPYSLAAKQSARVQVEALGKRSGVISLPIALAAPAIFTLNASGTGQGAILNQDYSVNSAASPAPPGSVIQIFATGEGAIEPEGIDGRLAIGTLPKPKEEVKVFIGGLLAELLYAGAAPGLVYGVIQINAAVPLSLSSGDFVVRFEAAGIPSQPGVTVSIR